MLPSKFSSLGISYTWEGHCLPGSVSPPNISKHHKIRKIKTMIKTYRSIHQPLSCPQSLNLSLSRRLTNQPRYSPLSFYIFLPKATFLSTQSRWPFGAFPKSLLTGRISLCHGHKSFPPLRPLLDAMENEAHIPLLCLRALLCLLPDPSFPYYSGLLLGSPDPDVWRVC